MLLFTCHVAFVCHIHSDDPLYAFSLQRVVRARGTRDRHVRSAYGYVSASVATQMQMQREDWLWDRAAPAGNRKPQGDAQTAAVLLLACGASVVSSFQLLSSVSPDGLASVRHLGYVFAPLLTASSAFGVVYLHWHGRNAAVSAGRVICGAIATTRQLFGLILPASKLAGWAAGAGREVAYLSFLQIALLAMVTLLPAYHLRQSSDDWYASQVSVHGCWS